MLLRAMADLDEELALWSAPVAAPAPPPSSADGMLCEPLAPSRSLARSLEEPTARDSPVHLSVMRAGGLRETVDDDTSLGLLEPISVALDADRRCAVGAFAEPTGSHSQSQHSVPCLPRVLLFPI